jgi:predicted extracellular nuclease
MRNLIRACARAGALAVALLAPAAYADTTPQTLPFTQNWSNAGLITADDTWSGVPGIVGYRGDNLTAATGTDPQSVLTDGSATPFDVNANQANPNTFTTGGVAEFAITDPTIALNGSGTADAPHIVIHLDTTGKSGIRVRYNLRDLDGSTDDAVSPVALQYRVGSSGDFINVPAGFVADATTGPSLASRVTAVDATLPTSADNQPLVQVRIITTNAVGNDEWVGIDDLAIDGVGANADAPVVGTCPSSLGVVLGTGGSASVSATDADDAVVSASISAGSVTGITLPFTASTGLGAPLLGILTVAGSVPVGNYPLTLLFANGDTPAQTATCQFTVTVTQPVVATRIHDIQDTGHLSSFNGNAVSNVPGIVTALRSNGFYMEDWLPDADPATSEGIFVFTNAAPSVAVGQTVLVSGTVFEFRPGGSGSTNLTTTEITAPTIVAIAPLGSLPPAVIIGNGGRVPPTQVIDDDAAGNVETGGTFDATTDGIDFYESLEGMRVVINNAVAVGPTNSFGEIPVVGDNGANAVLRTPRGGVIVQPDDFNPERVFLDDTIIGPGAMPVVNVGDVASTVTGVLDYSFGNFKLLVTSPPAFVPGGITPEVTALVGTADRLTVASYNVENLDPSDGAAKFDTLAAHLVNHLRAPDLVALVEVQDNNGATNNGVVDASATLQALVAAISAAGGPMYQFRQIDPVDNQDGGEPGGNIRVAFLFNPARLAFVDRPGAGSTTANAVTNAGGVPQLQYSPGRIDPGNAAFASSRKPLAGEFLFNGHRLFVIANHFNSKGGDEPLFGPSQPPQLSSEVQRNQQATVVAGFVGQILAIDANAKVIVLGDLNDFDFSSPLGILEAAGVTPLADTLAPGERYTYVFEGNSQALDHILVSGSLLIGAMAEYDVVHVNAEFADQASDHDPEVARLLLPPLRADVTPQFAVRSTGFVLNRLTGRFTNTVRLTNNGPTIGDPLRVVFDALPVGVTLANAHGTLDGKPYLEIPGGLAAGGTASVNPAYANPARVAITYTVRIYRGPF